jgi:hypothetical protein
VYFIVMCRIEVHCEAHCVTLCIVHNLWLLVNDFKLIWCNVLLLHRMHHFNWKVWLMWFHKKHLNKFFIQMNISVENNILLNYYFHLKDDTNYVAWRPLYQNPFYMFIKMLYKIKEKLPPKYTKIYPPQNTFSCLKWPPPPPTGVLSSVSFVLLCFHSWIFRVWRCSFKFHKKSKI